MPSGGHARSGPKPDPNSGRSDSGRNALGLARDGWVELPAKPASTRAPKWPLTLLSPEEKKLWAALWRKPQTTMWRKLGQEFQVAAYARAFLEATEFGAPASLKTAVLRMEDTLGLSTVGMMALRWRITTDDLTARRVETPTVEERPAPVRRLRAAG